jgi:hypothetical protein
MPEAQAGAQQSPEVLHRTIEAVKILRERGALKDDLCPRCNTDNWEVDFIAIPAVPLPKGGFNIPRNVVLPVSIGSGSTPSYIPALTLTCSNCGNTIIHNLKALGLLGAE